MRAWRWRRKLWKLEYSYLTRPPSSCPGYLAIIISPLKGLFSPSSFNKNVLCIHFFFISPEHMCGRKHCKIRRDERASPTPWGIPLFEVKKVAILQLFPKPLEINKNQQRNRRRTEKGRAREEGTHSCPNCCVSSFVAGERRKEGKSERKGRKDRSVWTRMRQLITIDPWQEAP